MTAKKTPEGRSKLVNKMFLVSVDKEAKVVEKKPTVSLIAQVPSAGYTQRDNYSKSSIQWLEYQMELARREGESLNIEHALNGGEVPILSTQYKVDGGVGNTVYEYHGKYDKLHLFFIIFIISVLFNTSRIFLNCTLFCT